jgi:ribonuclease P protein component
MLPQGERLSAEKVRMTLKNGKVLRTPGLVVRYLPAHSSAVAVVVSKKVAKGAVTRNAIRRAVYQALPRPLPLVQVVFMVQKQAPDYKADIQTICSKLSS